MILKLPLPLLYIIPLIPHDEVSAYGYRHYKAKGKDGLYSVETFVEKPAPEGMHQVIYLGRYLLTEIFGILENQKPGA